MTTSTNPYAARADVIVKLPQGYNASLLANADIDAYILDASREIDARLRDMYWPFNSITGTPATPAMIEHLCIMRSTIMCYDELTIAGHVPGPDGFMSHLWTRYLDDIQKIIDGKTVIPTETTSTETISWGAEPLDDDEHLFACSPKYVIPESVVITGLENGLDFAVLYKGENRGSILKKLSDFKNEAGTTLTTIASYDWSYKRYFENQPASPLWGTITRG